jgi:hypothetical protein
MTCSWTDIESLAPLKCIQEELSSSLDSRLILLHWHRQSTKILKPWTVFKLYNLEWEWEISAHHTCQKTRSWSWNSGRLKIPINNCHEQGDNHFRDAWWPSKRKSERNRSLSPCHMGGALRYFASLTWPHCPRHEQRFNDSNETRAESSSSSVKQGWVAPTHRASCPIM